MMTASLATRTTVDISLEDGGSLILDHTGVPLGVYLADNGADLLDGQTAVIGGQPVSKDTVLEPGAEVTIMPFYANG